MFAIVSTAPRSGGRVQESTRLVINGPACQVLSELNLIYLSHSWIDDIPYEHRLQSYVHHRLLEGSGIPIKHGGILATSDGLRFLVNSPDQVSLYGLIDRSTILSVTPSCSSALTSVHIMPYRETLPPGVDPARLFTEYLEPLLLDHPRVVFHAGRHFTHGGIHFKIVSTSTPTGRRISPQTVISCHGMAEFITPFETFAETLYQLEDVPIMFEMDLPNPDQLSQWETTGYFEGISNIQFPYIEYMQSTLRISLCSEYCDRLKLFWEDGTGLNHDPILITPVKRLKPDRIECTICLTPILPYDKQQRLPCTHQYHVTCIQEWLSRSRDCPNCRAKIEN
jgi:hypothetical protein